MLPSSHPLTRAAIGLWLLATTLGGACSCGEPRADDALEPNDDFDEATPLAPGTPVEARANQDDPDVFVIDAGPEQVIVFSLEHRGLENCPTFQVHDPDRVELVGQDPASDCGVSADATRLVPGAAVRELGDGDYEIEVPAATEGKYYLTIVEDSEADNIAPFSWDYRLTATLSS